MTIRSLGVEEWRLWRELRLRALADSPDAFRATLAQEWVQPDEWWMELVGSTVEHPRGGLWVAETHGEAVGMLFGRLGPAFDVLAVGAMWVAPRSRRGGVGAGLLRAVMGWARDAGATRADLWVTEDNAGALSFYRKLGFVPTADTDPLREGSRLIVRRLTGDLRPS